LVFAMAPVRTETSVAGQSGENGGVENTADSFLNEAARLSDPRDAPLSRAASLERGDIVADRFVIQRMAGRGGMGIVYQALDRVSGAPVALKLIANIEGDATRFAREAQVLARLSHPAIVRYVAHGVTRRSPFLAMEWLDGQDLAARLARGGLLVPDALMLLRRVASGLVDAHAQGILHRDIKPSNVFLVDDDPARAKLIDFGIARMDLSRAPTTMPLTRSGILLGTVGYMAPEQAIADGSIDLRADIFSLGAVLFECLTGEPAFVAKQVVGVLAKVLREDAPRVRRLRPELPMTLDELVARMMARDRSERPRDATEILAALESLGSLSGDAPIAASRISIRLSAGEQRFVSVILATGAVEASHRPVEIARQFGGEYVRLINGVLVVTFESPTSPSEQAMRAAACALALREAFPTARMCLVTGRTDVGPNESPASVVDRAVCLLAGSDNHAINVDSVTAGLIGNHFELAERGESLALCGVASKINAPRTLLGRATPCVGRDKELALLEATWRECLQDSVTRAVVITGPAGQGKSRLWHEFVARLRDARAVVTRSDAVGAGSAFLIVRQLVRQVFGLTDGLVAEATVRNRLSSLFGSEDANRIADFLLELLGHPSSPPASPQLRAARNDPGIMANWLRQSFGEWLVAESAKSPLLVVVEDLHWGDLPSVMYLGDVLRATEAKSLMVLALARPEVHQAFPGLWAGAELQEIALSRMTVAAAERLIRMVTGDAFSTETVAAIVRRADGNAFYLEELIRCSAEGVGTLPDTVLALAQSRLHQLDADKRRIVRAASVFGDVFWRGGVERLLGAVDRDADVAEGLEALVAREVFESVKNARFAGHIEYTFRHALLREAAYAMLTNEDRVTGHSLAGEWLESVGARDPLMLAYHFEVGEQSGRALPHLLRAQQTAYDGGNVPAVLELTARGVRCGAEGAELATLRLTDAMALALRAEWRRAVPPALEAMGLLPVGSTSWFLAASQVFLAGMFLGDANITAPLLQQMLSVDVPSEPSGPYGLAVNSTCLGLIGLGAAAMARGFIDRVLATHAVDGEADVAFVLRVRAVIGFLQIAESDLAGALTTLAQARSLAERAGDIWGRLNSSMHYVCALAEAGAGDRVEVPARETIAYGQRMGLTLFTDWTYLHWAAGLRNVGRLEQAERLARPLLQRTEPLLVVNARALLAQLSVLSGDHADGVREAERALEDGALFPAVHAAASATFALAELRQGRPESALTHSARGLEAAARSAWPRDHSLLRLVHAEALHASGRNDEAREAIARARSRVGEIAQLLDPEKRRWYETGIAENARTIALAADWLGDASNRGVTSRSLGP
jgi:eukaryotic-like serine/threonine-protein kinase